MNDDTKKYILAGVVVVALVIAAFSIFKSTAGETEKVVGELPMAAGGGRDAEKGATTPGATPAGGDPASGMPPEAMNPR